MQSAEPSPLSIRQPASSFVPLTALTAALVILLLDGGTSPFTLLAASSILILATLARWPHYPASTKAGACMALFLLLAFITVIPLPAPLLRVNGSESASHHALSEKTLSDSFDAGVIRKGERWSQISRNRAGTMRAILLLSIALLSASLAGQLTERSRNRLLLILGAIAAITGVAGLISLFIIPQLKTFWWLLPVLHGKPVACFINANHFGSFMAVAAVLMFGMACRNTFKSIWASGLLLPALFILLSIAVLASRSTGALLAFGTGMMAASLINLRRRPAFVITMLLILAAGLLAIPLAAGKSFSLKTNLKPLIESDSNPSVRLRLDTWKDAVSVLKDYPVFGTGLNAFRTVFPRHRTSSTRKEHDNVENEYIQIPVESGIAGTLILLTALFFFIRPMFSRSIPNENLLPVVIPCLLAAAAHCFVDFPVRIPLYMMLCAVLLGFCTADKHRLPAGQYLPLQLAAGIAAITLILSLINPHRTFSLDNPDYLNTADPDELAEAVASAPSYWCAYYNLGRHSAQNPELRELAESQITAASRLNPLNYKLLLELAKLRLDMGRNEEAADAYRQAKTLRNWVNVPDLEALLKQN